MILTDADFRAFLEREGITGYDGWTEAEALVALGGAQEWAIEQTDREWEPVTEARYFTGNALAILQVFECSDSVTEVVVNGTSIALSLFQVLPLNAAVRTQLRRKNSGWTAPTDGSVGNIVVTATWGRVAPQDVKDAICFYALSLGQGGAVVSDPTAATFSRVSALSISFDKRTAEQGAKAADAPVEKARGLLQSHVDLSARRSRLLQGVL